MNTNTTARARIKALDLFAGTGWGVACRRLGIKEMGVEIMEEAVKTRAANGMETIYRDVWDGLLLTAQEHLKAYGPYGLLIASPPCQTFSLAGNGAGRKALDEVIEAISVGAYKDPAALKEFGEKHDPRTALVLAPLAYVWRDRPRLVAMEQVITVLPVWEACAQEMRGWGYDVKVEILNAEQYGVPQTRRRAILVARRNGAVHLPVPTHSRYHSRNPSKLDPGVLKWVSMAEALGWGMTDAPMPTVVAGAKGMTDRYASGGNSVRRMIDAKIGGPDWIDPPAALAASRTADPRQLHDVRLDVPEVSLLQTYPPYTGRGLTDRPAPTITGGGTETGGAEPIAKLARYTEAPGWTGSTERLSTDEAATLQTYPAALRSNYSDPATGSGRGERGADQPAPTLTSKADRNKWDGGRALTEEEAAALQTYPPAQGWGYTDRPSPTIAAGGGANGASGIEIWSPRTREDALEKMEAGTFIGNGRVVNPDTKLDPLRMTPEEAARLQSYPPYPEGTVAFTQNNRQAHQSRRPMDHPAPTVTAGHDSSNRGFLDADGNLTQATPEQVAALQTYPMVARELRSASRNEEYGERPGRPVDRPAYTLRTSNVPPGWVWDENQAVTVPEASTLQTYEPPFIWTGTKSKKFLQIGNAVPPLLAEAILAALIGVRPGR